MSERSGKRPRLGHLAPKATKTVLGRALQALDASVLEREEQTSLRQLRKEVAKDVGSHAYVDTPYGKVVQARLGIDIADRVEYVDPSAWLWYMCQISAVFRSLMSKICKPSGEALTIVIYNDGLVPGNPFRADKARSIKSFYWVIAEFPDHVFCRAFCWPTFMLIRKV